MGQERKCLCQIEAYVGNNAKRVIPCDGINCLKELVWSKGVGVRTAAAELLRIDEKEIKSVDACLAGPCMKGLE